MSLEWPAETVLPPEAVEPWYQVQSNRVLDFHGDPVRAELVVFSDGNHHMALGDVLKAFYLKHPDVQDIFYATTPPAPIAKILRQGAIRLGNLTIFVRPHIFMGPPHVLDRLQAEGMLRSHQLLARNQGSVLLIAGGNPKQIESVGDLMRKDVRLFISNPETETVSHEGYRRTLEGVAERLGLDPAAFNQAVFGDTAVWGQRIHHREAPEALADGRADAAIVYFHLALRYTRIFPDLFDFLPLGGTREKPQPYAENRVGKIHLALVDDGGPWGRSFTEFILSRTAADIYAGHGLCHVQDIPTSGM
ncbi:MAG: substrate-binding domain-containing protein [Desulfobacteraceae bacterium]